MIEETGLVVSVQGDLAEVQGQPQSACGGCAVDGTCGTSLLARYLGPRRLSLRASNAIGARPGERVVIGLPEGALLEASVLAYLAPLVALVGGAVAGASVVGRIAPAYTQVASVLAGLGGLAAALVWLVRLIRARSLGERYRPRILRRLAASPGEPPEVKRLSENSSPVEGAGPSSNRTGLTGFSRIDRRFYLVILNGRRRAVRIKTQKNPVHTKQN